jgi:hypothetical protein
VYTSSGANTGIRIESSPTSGTLESKLNIKSSGATAPVDWWMWNNGSDTKLRFYGSTNGWTGYTTNDDHMVIDTSGNVGIGTASPSAKLHVIGNQYIYGPEESWGGTGHILLYETTANTGQMRIGVNRAYGFIDTHGSNQPLVFNSNYGASVGINERSPTERLHVNGNILASGNITAYSDKRIKSDITKIENALDKIEKLNGYTYTVKDERYTGLIAQEVLPVLPEAVTGSEETQYGLAYGNMMGLVVEAIKELREEIKNVRFFARL